MTIFKKITLLTTSSFLLGQVLVAQTYEVVPKTSNITELRQLIDVLATWLFNIGVPIAVMIIVYAGVKFILSKGKPDEVTTAKRILIYAIIGLLILFIGRGFEALVRGVIGLGG